MIIDSRSHAINTEIEYDVCIIGAGAAGITTALELAADKNIKLVMLEAGGEYFNHMAQSLYKGEVKGDKQSPLWRARFSGLGGSTQVWAGWCRPLEAFDFERRDYITNSGWPISFDELTSAYHRANEICALGPYSYELADWQQQLNGAPLAVDAELKHHIFQVRKLRFNQHYCEYLQTAENITLYLYCPVMRLHAESDGKRISHVEIASYSGKITTLKAKQFVLATGGIENARLLLLSGETPEQALGNQNDCVGRYFIDHGFIDSGWFLPANKNQDMSYYFPAPLTESHPQQSEPVSLRPIVTLSPAVLQKEKLLNGAMYFYTNYESHRVFGSDAVKAALELWDITKGKSAQELFEIMKAEEVPGELWDFFKRMATRPHHVVHAILRKVLVNDSVCQRWRLRFYYECTPSAENRVVLTEKKDRFGRLQAHVNWQLAEQDMDSAYRFHVYLNELLQKSGAGQLTFFDEISQWQAQTETGKHPSGTTRMHDDPKQGVVDRNCQVHGVDNLFIAGSSVFPTVGYANPTLTIVALAVRLAEHLQQINSRYDTA